MHTSTRFSLLPMALGLLVVVAPIGDAAAVTPATTLDFGCGLRDSSGVFVPGAFSNQPIGADVGSGTPSNPVLQEIAVSADIGPGEPVQFSFSCSVTANTRGPVSESSVSYQGFAFNAQAYRNISAIDIVTGYFSVQAAQPGGPSSVPISMIVYQKTAIDLTLGSSLSMQGASRFTAPPVPNMGGVGNLPGKVPDDSITPTCVDPICERTTTLDGDAQVGVEYSYSLQTEAFLSGFLAAPLPSAAAGSVVVSSKALAYIDPSLEFAPGERYVDYFEVVYSDNVTPIGVARTTPSGVGPGETYHLLFVTSQKRDGSSPLVDDYNDFVNQVADDAGIGPNVYDVLGEPIDWVAIASTETVNARDNAAVTGAVYRIDGTRVADDFSDLWDGDVQAPPDADEFGLQLPWHPLHHDPYVFTGSRGDGAGNQTSGQLGTVVAASGLADSTGLGWINEQGLSSVTERRFYALSEALVALPEPVAGLSTLTALCGLAWLRVRSRGGRTRPAR